MASKRLRTGLTTGALIAGALVVAPPTVADPAVAETDYTLSVDAGATGPTIEETMYGVFFEDINHAADGGLYAELIQNRSFEFTTQDNASYTPLTGWREVSAGASGTAEVVDDDGRLNENNRNYLRLALNGDGGSADAGFGLANAGWGGIALTEGAGYDFSVWARTDQAATPLTVTLRDEHGAALAAPLTVEVTSGEWTRYQGTLTADATTDAGQVEVVAGGAGTVALDMVSLFPQDTFRDRPNGLRPDLAQAVADLEPSFVRFPGGCIVNTGTHEAYEAPDYPRERSFQWKETVGPVEERPTNHNFWGYNQSYGLGYFEYFQFSEDIGAMPLPVLPALVTGCGENQHTDDPELLQRHIQDALDLIEFANGPTDSTWGGLRAEMGHPEPFGLTHVAIGNEENLAEEFYANFEQFRAAIEAEYPEITVVSNSGPGSSGPLFDDLWRLNTEGGVDMVDEHYYNDPTWFLENNDRYDSYDREGPDVFLGEYASRDNTFYNALAEASFLTGLERNADVVKMASYAPLFAMEDSYQWHPDLIWFNNRESWPSASYEVQKLFSVNRGHEVVPSQASTTPIEQEPISGGIGLGTWLTSATYDDVEVTSADGETLFADDFSGGADRWSGNGNGSWQIVDGAYAQTDAGVEDALVIAGDTGWTDYDLKLTATKQSGEEGFLIAFGVQDTGNYYWWNLGGWGNTRSAVERGVNGARSPVLEGDTTTIEEGRAYDIEVQVRGREVTLLLDGQEWGSFTDDAVAEPFRQVVTRDQETGELIVKVVNAQDDAARTAIDLGNEVQVGDTAEVTVLQGDPEAVNTRTERPIQPETSTFEGVANAFSYTFPPNSVTFLRIPTEP
ncbi:alpha-N-arabinofuranosidase [Streptomyces sp. 3MP-14]|uniref:non-reducing end alpha-L-arabinofuranosidase n=1 Tax=Streptomyces mimosae TaxID=2586635 RepID=A0A5N5ZY41_9ACTN|nr:MULTISPECIES: alpha-L-arabinofuranosidase C-terminal domain-containing protein [Streptomyces]KAB8161185.1 alpha-N-arabinofuranosidase [Streptomyces mimosae]KAB8178996.1 alpha-N-arabinofuranosidase [Streptomyces sp. 3MP-14]